MAATSSQLYSAAAAQNVLPSYLLGSARIAPTNLPMSLKASIKDSQVLGEDLPVSPTASIKGSLVLGEVWRAKTQVPL